FDNVGTQRIKPAGRIPTFGELRGYREDQWLNTQQPAGIAGDEAGNFLDLCVAFQQVDLVQDDDDLLAPVADFLQESPFRFTEGPVGRGDKQYQIRPRHKALRNRLMLPE